MISSVGRISKRRAIPLLFSGGAPLAKSGYNGFDTGVDGDDFNGFSDDSTGWKGAWVVAPFYLPGYLGIDAFDYTDALSISALSGGLEWSGAFVLSVHYTPAYLGSEDFGSLTISDSLSGANSGFEWSGVWVVH